MTVITDLDHLDVEMHVSIFGVTVIAGKSVTKPIRGKSTAAFPQTPIAPHIQAQNIVWKLIVSIKILRCGLLSARKVLYSLL